MPSTARGLSALPLEIARRLFGMLLPEVFDVIVDAFWEAQLAIDVAGLRVVRVRTDREVLPRLPVENALALRRIVVVRLHLTHQAAHVFLGVFRLPREHGKHLVLAQEEAP